MNTSRIDDNFVKFDKTYVYRGHENGKIKVKSSSWRILNVNHLIDVLPVQTQHGEMYCYTTSEGGDGCFYSFEYIWIEQTALGATMKGLEKLKNQVEPELETIVSDPHFTVDSKPSEPEFRVGDLGQKKGGE